MQLQDKEQIEESEIEETETETETDEEEGEGMLVKKRPTRVVKKPE